HAMPYAFLDDAPLEERRTQAVVTAQRGARVPSAEGSELDPAVVEQVAQEAWPEPQSAADLHEALSWMGWLEDGEVAAAWRPWLDELAADGRAGRDGARWFAAGAGRDPVSRWRGRLEAVLPIDAAALPDEER